MYDMMYRGSKPRMGRIRVNITYEEDIIFLGLTWFGAGMSVN